MINIFVKEVVNLITNSLDTEKMVIDQSYKCPLSFSSIVKPNGHFCIDDYIFGMYHDNISICVARMLYTESLQYTDDWKLRGWYNLSPQIVIGDGKIWTPEYGTLPICITEEKYFQEMTRTNMKDLEIEDFIVLNNFNNLIRDMINECRENT